ncbi:hypothetical protein [Methanosphaera cuniculi]|uniref:Uncharacterized protein n=1 Tax=Methanosphaera cuniculi TaxID=1077256 RepID=A0A2A2HBS2_9EURY|nr:hypothetical protein [Methanosphaera cuniculi]PAV06746.1 hypothetical protein ASJ82_06225 [Methanosphaera cuniculi]PWL07504.1 hypothetical protein MSCUN_15860 [Methanosphaera cuniculi]
MADDMIKMYIEKRHKYEAKIQQDLKKIEKSAIDIAEVGDYFSVQNDELLITIKAIMKDDEKHIAVYTNENPTEIPLCELTITENPDLIMWIIQNDQLIKEGFKEVLINAVRNAENIVNTLKQLKVNYE